MQAFTLFHLSCSSLSPLLSCDLKRYSSRDCIVAHSFASHMLFYFSLLLPFHSCFWRSFLISFIPFLFPLPSSLVSSIACSRWSSVKCHVLPLIPLILFLYLLLQLFDRVSCTYSYLLADGTSRSAVLIDPVRDMVQRDISLIQELGLKVQVHALSVIHSLEMILLIILILITESGTHFLFPLLRLSS